MESHAEKQPAQSLQADIAFSSQDRDGLYKTIFNRRDVRGQFLPDPVPDEVLSRVLYAAHHAPSVGFMQPWDFVLVQDRHIKEQVRRAFDKAHHEAALMFTEDKRETYRNLKLEGILESPVNICVTCDRRRAGPVVIGRTHIPAMDLYSSVCAVQNLWLAARAEGLGLGWVSILDEGELQEVLGLPAQIVPVAYLCLGYVSHLYAQPELQSAGWLPRLPLTEVVHFDRWQQGPTPETASLLRQIDQDRELVSRYVTTRPAS